MHFFKLKWIYKTIAPITIKSIPTSPWNLTHLTWSCGPRSFFDQSSTGMIGMDEPLGTQWQPEGFKGKATLLKFFKIDSPKSHIFES